MPDVMAQAIARAMGELREVTIASLETAAFLFAEPADDGMMADIDAGPPLVRATVAVEEPFVGSLTLRCPTALLPALASNMTGEDAVSEAMHHDALGEMANVICGAILPILYPDARFRLKAPVVTVSDTLESPAHDAFVVRTRFNVDGFLMEGILHLPSASLRAIPLTSSA